MKICRIANPFPTIYQIKGDLGPNYYYLSKYTADRGFDVHVITGRENGQSVYEEIDGIKIHRVAPLKNRRSYLFGEFAGKCFEKVNEIKPDLIHGHTSVHFGCLWNKRKIKAPIITHFHTVLDAYKYMDYLPFSFDPKTAVIDRLVTRSYFYENRYVLSKSDYIIAVSKYCAESIKRYVPNATVKVIYNGINFSTFKYIESNIKEKINAKYLILYVGRPVPWKGIQYLLKATEELNKEFKGLKVLLIGVDRPDSQIYLRWLKKISEKYELVDVIFSKPVNYAELPVYYYAADCFVLPSYPDASPKVIYEALACGTPIVATNSGGIPELIEGTENLLVRPKDSNDLANKLKYILSENNIARETKVFTWEHSANEIIKLYEEINK